VLKAGRQVRELKYKGKIQAVRSKAGRQADKGAENTKENPGNA
jgi:hypothetical protein